MIKQHTKAQLKWRVGALGSSSMNMLTRIGCNDPATPRSHFHEALSQGTLQTPIDGFSSPKGDKLSCQALVPNSAGFKFRKQPE